jgi:glutamine synthetase
MSLSRFNALQSMENRIEPFPTDLGESATENIASYFGENVFNDEAMRSHLPENAYLTVKAAVQNGQKLSREIADVVALGMKKWAESHNCTTSHTGSSRSPAKRPRNTTRFLPSRTTAG